MISLNNRRYIGNKHRLLPFVINAIDNNIECTDYSFADLFAGTGVVSYEIAKRGNHVIVNDMLYSNIVAYKAWLSNSPIDEKKLNKLIDNFNSIGYQDLEDNYFSDVYGGKYFSVNDAKKIGYIRECIENSRKNISEREYYVLLASLMYATDKIANTVGHFEYFLKKTPEDSNFRLEMLNLAEVGTVEIFNEDANCLAKKISANVVYLDPPYNARQYVNFYHVLENLTRWDKPTEFEGKSMKFKRDNLKSGYSRSEAPILFGELVESLKCDLIVVSYNNTYQAKSVSSINKISEQQILEILSNKGNVTKQDIKYEVFNAGKTDLKDHRENLFICKVR